MRWALRKLGVDKWLTCTDMALYTVDSTVFRPTILMWLFTAVMDVVFRQTVSSMVFWIRVSLQRLS